MDVEQRGAHAVLGDSVSEPLRDAFDQAVVAQSAQIVGGPARGIFAGQNRLGAQMAAELPRAEYPWQDRQDDKRVHERMHAWIAEAQPGDDVAAGRGDRIVDVAEGILARDAVVRSSLDAEKASIGGEADGPERAQVAQAASDGEVAGVVDGSLGAKCSALRVVLLDAGAFVVDVQRRHHAVADDAGAEVAGRGLGHAAIEDELDLRGMTDDQVVLDDLVEELTTGQGPIEDLGQRELGLEDRELVLVAGGAIGGREGLRQDRQPFAQQLVKL